MSIALLIISCLLWVCAIAAIATRPILAPALSYLGLACVSFCATPEGYPWVPVSWTMLVCWLCMSLVVMLATMMQPEAIRRQTRGMGYMTVGGIAGMILGLLGVTFGVSINTLYGIMIVATVGGIFFGFLLYSNTPDGRAIGIKSGHFFRYLLAKGFPAAVTLMQIGVVLVITVAIRFVD